MLAPAIWVLLFAAGAASIPSFLVFRLRRDLHRLRSDAATAQELYETFKRLSGELETLQTRLRSIEASREQQADWLAKSESIHLNRRGQILRLHKNGESEAAIASALRIHASEVKLIIKIHELSRSTAALT